LHSNRKETIPSQFKYSKTEVLAWASEEWGRGKRFIYSETEILGWASKELGFIYSETKILRFIYQIFQDSKFYEKADFYKIKAIPNSLLKKFFAFNCNVRIYKYLDFYFILIPGNSAKVSFLGFV
jgi:hypothetical protein